MKQLFAVAVAAVGLALAGTSSGAGAAEHHMVKGNTDVKWGDGPAAFPAGLKFAVIDGDPASTGPLTVRLRMPAGYKIAPHWHPTDEHVTVLSGTLSLGMGDTVDKAHSAALSAGGYAVAPANMHHYAWTKTGATIQVHMMGPFAITYVNPADDPTHSSAK